MNAYRFFLSSQRSRRFGAALMLAVLAVAVILWPQCALGQQSALPKLTLAQVEQLVSHGVPDSTLSTQIQRRGLSFIPTPALIDSLRAKGAGSLTLAAIGTIGPGGTNRESSRMPVQSPGGAEAFGVKKEDVDADDIPDPNAPKAAVIIHGDLKVTMACEPGNGEMLCAGLIANIGDDEGYFSITGSDYPKHAWARTGDEGPARIFVENFRLGDQASWNDHRVWMPAKSVTRFWFSYECRHPDAAKTAHIDLDMMWNGNDSLGFDLPEVPVNSTTYRALDVKK